MRWMIVSVMVFFGTMLAAAAMALGEPALAELAVVEAVRHGSDAVAVWDTAGSLLQRMWDSPGSAAGR